MAKINKNNAWPVGIAVLYTLFVILLIVFLIFSTYNKIELVSEDYYNKEIEYQKQIDRIKLTHEFGYEVSWAFDKNRDVIIIQFPDELDYASVRGEIHLFRVSDADLDRSVPIRLTNSGLQYIPGQSLRHGYWRIKILWDNPDGRFYSEGVLTIPYKGGRENG